MPEYEQGHKPKAQYLEVKSDEEIKRESAATEKKRLEVKAERKTLYEVNEAKYSLKLEKGNHGLQLIGTIKPKAKGKFINQSQLVNLLKKELKLTGEIEREAALHFCGKACRGEPQTDITLMWGKDPIKGKDERIEFEKRPMTSEPRYEKDKLGNIDYHNLHLFDPVYEGDLIGTLAPAEAGIPGETVDGEPIKAISGLPFESPVDTGMGVKFNPKDETFVATMSGYVMYENNLMSIKEEYIVNGDVDFEVGNITFPGTVEVKGNVIDEFNISADKGIYVKGNVGNCKLESEGDIEIGGIFGNETGTIKCGGNLTARYLNDAIIECKGNIIAKNEIVNCDVKCGGYIDINAGAIIGGKLQSYKGIDAKTVGKESGGNKLTYLTVGVDYTLEEKISELKTELKEREKQLGKVSKILDPYMKNPEEMKKLNEERIQAVRALAGKFTALNKIKSEIEQKLEQLIKENKENANPIISAKQSIDAGVVIIIDEVRQEVNEKLMRPVSIIKNSRKPALRFLSRYPIIDNVDDIEKAVVEEEKAQELEKAGLEAEESEKNE